MRQTYRRETNMQYPKPDPVRALSHTWATICLREGGLIFAVRLGSTFVQEIRLADHPAIGLLDVQHRRMPVKSEMHVIAHQSEGMHPAAEATHPFGEQLVEELPIPRSEEHILPGVAAQDDVIKTAGDVQTGFAGHASNLSRRNNYAIYQA